MGKKIIEVVSNQKYCIATFFKGLNASWTGGGKIQRTLVMSPKLVTKTLSLSRALYTYSDVVVVS